MFEIEFGLDPSKIDTDANDINDGDEDKDSDNLSNIIEALLNLDPTNNDTDGDQLLDGEEDFDSDGLSNQDEIKCDMYNPKLDPTKSDSNNNQISDFDEELTINRLWFKNC